MDVVFWLAVLRLIAYGVLAPICMLLGIDRFNLGRGWSAGFYCSLCVFFLTFLVLIVVDFSGGVEVTWLLRLRGDAAGCGFCIFWYWQCRVGFFVNEWRG